MAGTRPYRSSLMQAKQLEFFVMTRFILAAGVAALAITAPAASAPGGKSGHDHSQQTRAEGHAKAKVKAKAQAKANDRSKERVANVKARARVDARQKAEVRTAEKARVETRARAKQRVDVRAADARQAERIRDARERQLREARASQRDRIERLRDVREVQADRIRDLRARERARVNLAENVGYGVGGCPPGLLNKNCMPPGQAKKLLGQRLNVVRERVAFRDLPKRLRYVYRDTPDYYYRYGDGYIYRVNRKNDLISALLPMFGLGYGIGQPFPTSYSNYYMPAGLQPFYPNTPYTSYRYANGYVYQVDPITGLIEDVDPMLGYGYGYGQMMPAAYSAYNVPYQYRPYYYDTPNYAYRYAPGAIYQVDPQTSLITAVAALLSPGLTVGQPLPMGYSAYNVPYAYRSNYYDTPDAMYRYANGNIYRVDPATQLVTALVVSALT
jgi:hypothetical protein